MESVSRYQIHGFVFICCSQNIHLKLLILPFSQLLRPLNLNNIRQGLLLRDMGDSLESYRCRIGCFTQPKSWRNVRLPGKYSAGGKYEPRDSCYGLVVTVFVLAVIVYGANGLIWCVDKFPDTMMYFYGNNIVTDTYVHSNCLGSFSDNSNCFDPIGKYTNMAPYVPLMLSLAGDIELNPGPETMLATKEQVDKLTAMMTEMLAWSRGIDEKFTALTGRLSGLEEQTKINTDKLKKLDDLETELKASKDENKLLQDQLLDINDRFDANEDRSRRNNLMFCGIVGNSNEKWEESELKVKHFIKHNLGTHAGDGFERAHRIPNGPKVNGFAPIIVNFSRYKDKERVLHQAHRLKGSSFFLREDFSAGTRKIRKLLLDKKKELGTANVRKAQLKYKKLVVTFNSGETKAFVVQKGSNTVVTK